MLLVFILTSQLSVLPPPDMKRPNAHSSQQIECTGTIISQTRIDRNSGSAFVVDHFGGEHFTQGFNPQAGGAFAHQYQRYGEPLRIDRNGTHWAMHSQQVGATEFVWGKRAIGSQIP